jgi:hypothetical protein
MLERYFVFKKMKIRIVTWMAKALLGNDSVNMLEPTQQYKHECSLIVAGQQEAHQ